VFKVASRINSTWGGGLTDMVRFGRYLEIIEAEELVDSARVVGEHLLHGLLAVQDELGGKLSGTRGRGLMIAFDLETPELRKKAHQKIVENGLLLLMCGTRSIRFRPPLNLTAAEADAGLDIVRKTLKGL
jgi:L-lysine 6-transaminase